MPRRKRKTKEKEGEGKREELIGGDLHQCLYINIISFQLVDYAPCFCWEIIIIILSWLVGLVVGICNCLRIVSPFFLQQLTQYDPLTIVESGEDGMGVRTPYRLFPTLCEVEMLFPLVLVSSCSL